MRPRLLHELSRHIAILLEDGIRGGTGERRIPVYLCHPLDLLESRAASHDEPAPELGDATKPRGALYLAAVSPDPRYRRVAGGREPAARMPFRIDAPLWVRLRYVFLVLGATLEEELGALAAALVALHEQPFLDLAALRGDEAAGEELDVEAAPVTVLDSAEAWRELGLAEHRLSVGFEVSLPLSARRAEPMGRIVERSFRLDAAREPDSGGSTPGTEG